MADGRAAKMGEPVTFGVSLERWHQPWRFVVPRWFKCWHKTRHHHRTFMGGGRQWTECYCGLRCFGTRGGPGA